MNSRVLLRLALGMVIGGSVCAGAASGADRSINNDPKLRAELQGRLDLFAKWLGEDQKPAKDWVHEALTEDFITFGGIPKDPALGPAAWIKQTDWYQKTITSCDIKIVGPIIAAGNVAVTVTREECMLKSTGKPDHYRSLFVWEKIDGKWKIARQGESEGPMPD